MGKPIISLNNGHTVFGKGYGACYGSFKESQITRAVGGEVIRLLKSEGYTVHNSTVNYAISQNSYLKRVVNMANSKEIDLFLSIHCNSSVNHNSHGCEVYTYGGKRLPVAVAICEELEELGFTNRNVKNGSHLYVVKNTKAPAILVELFFLDAKCDQNRYKKLGYTGLAKAIVNAISKI